MLNDNRLQHQNHNDSILHLGKTILVVVSRSTLCAKGFYHCLSSLLAKTAVSLLPTSTSAHDFDSCSGLLDCGSAVACSHQFGRHSSWLLTSGDGNQATTFHSICICCFRLYSLWSFP